MGTKRQPFPEKLLSETNLKLSVQTVIILSLVVMLMACASSLSQAKLTLAQAQVLERSFQTEQALALYRRTLNEASREVRKRPSAQGYLMKGLAEFKLSRWADAAQSFSLAASLGEDKAESWAKEVSLYGLALSFEEQGLEKPAVRLFSILSEKGKFSPLTRASLGKVIDHRLGSLNDNPSSQQDKILSDSIKIVEKALADDPGCGFYHYLLSQLLSHQEKYQESFEEAVMARELGLPSEEIHRDNDNQIIFCYRSLKQSMEQAEFTQFNKTYKNWIQRWKWPDEQTPDWKRR